MQSYAQALPFGNWRDAFALADQCRAMRVDAFACENALAGAAMQLHIPVFLP